MVKSYTPVNGKPTSKTPQWVDLRSDRRVHIRTDDAEFTSCFWKETKTTVHVAWRDGRRKWNTAEVTKRRIREMTEVQV